MVTSSNGDDRGDWMRQFMSEDEFRDMLDKTNNYIANNQEGLVIPIHLTYNDCIRLCYDWHIASLGDKPAQFRLHQLVGTFILWIEEMLQEEGINWREEF